MLKVNHENSIKLLIRKEQAMRKVEMVYAVQTSANTKFIYCLKLLLYTGIVR